MLMHTAGEKGEGKTTFKPLHYKGTPIHRIVKGFIIQGGDFSEGKHSDIQFNLGGAILLSGHPIR